MILDAFQLFSADKFKDAQNMEHSLACLVSYELKVPPIRSIFFCSRRR